MNPLVLTRKEAAAALKMSEWQLDRLIADGLIPKLQIPSRRPGESNRRVLLAYRDVEAFVARRGAVGK